MEMKKELLELLNVVKKAAAAAEGGEAGERRCLDALYKLKSVPVTAELLVSTKIGKHIRPLREHPKKAIRGVASEMVAIWTKKILQKADKDKKDAILNSVAQKTASNVLGGDALRDKVLRKAVKDKKDAALIMSKAGVDDKVAQKTVSNGGGGDALREKVRQHLVEALSKVSGEAKEDIKDAVSSRNPDQVAQSLESALFQAWGNLNGKQRAMYRSLLFNIKDPKNPDFRRRVLLGQVELQDVAKLSTQEMASDELQQKIHQMEAKAVTKRMAGIADKGTTDQFKCGRCGKREATYFQLQTRSADEPMTTFVTCMACNHHWKF